MLDQTTFKEYKRQLAASAVILLSQKEDNGFKVIRPKTNSRYFPEGRKKIKAKIYKRLGSWASANGIMVSLTINPALYTKEEAWYYFGKMRRDFLRKINKWRKYNGMSKAKGCWTIEVQKQTGYPHVHGIFPNLRYLAPVKELKSAWGQHSDASVDVTYRDNFSPTSYMLKYITKMDDWTDEYQNYIWLFGTRLYSMSRDYTLPNYADKRAPEWKYYMHGSIQELSLWWLSRKHLLQRIREGPVAFGRSTIDDALLFEAGLN